MVSVQHVARRAPMATPQVYAAPMAEFATDSFDGAVEVFA
ncbi:Uncharacterised protein [Mycolicibacterium vanbaalenii]|uniref:Uncharacterized protein n=1 Tax=Mycolicibacterium vanbaalenii TaxID=110539 RepID=A0A5S9NWA9_MYCVN|nr:Uncharacterised protein [Mycolicibacterium vanbaalenii]